MTSQYRRTRPAIVGVGFSPMVRKAGRSLSAIAADTALQAIADAGLAVSDIDGYCGSPGAPNPSAVHADGIDEISAGLAISLLGLEQARWVLDVRSMPAGAVATAAAALEAGLCNYVLVLRAMYNPTGVRYPETRQHHIGGPSQFTLPFGLGDAGGRHALWLQRYMHESGATREELYTVVRTAREHANLNPHAYWKDRPLSLDDYLKARWIYEPMCLFDCDIPVTGAGAVVLTTAERARDLSHRPAYVRGVTNHARPGQSIFDVSGITRSDVGVAQIYDGFSHFLYYFLEELGFCGRHEAHAFIQNGRIGLGGELPVNTFGGNLGEGRLHGFGHVREGALQVMGRAGERQATRSEYCLVAVGVGHPWSDVHPGSIPTYLMLSSHPS